MKAYLLARVSTDDQKDALPAQTIRLKDYAKKTGYNYELFEIQESAFKGDRQAFRAVVDKIEQEPDPIVVVFDKIDRLTRDPTSPEYIRLVKYCDKGRIELHFPSDNIFVHERSPASDKMRLGLGITMSQYYSATISDNVRRRQAQMLRDGIWTGAAPFGYRYTQHGDKKWIEVDEFSAAVVRYSFETYATGVSSLHDIVKGWRDKFGLQVQRSRIEATLKNSFYYGEMRVKNTLYPHKYEKIITRELFDKVQEVRDGYAVRPYRWAGLPYPYRSLVSCAECGCIVTFETKKKKYTYGHCTKKKYPHESKYVREENLTEQFTKMIDAIHIPDNILQKLLEFIREEKNDSESRIKKQRAAMEAEIIKYDTRMDKMYDDRLEGLVSDERYREKHKEFTKSKEALQRDLQRLELLDNKRLDNLAYLLKLASKAPELFKKAKIDEKRQLLKTIGSNFLLDGKLLRWQYRNTFDLVAKCNKSANWQG